MAKIAVTYIGTIWITPYIRTIGGIGLGLYTAIEYIMRIYSTCVRYSWINW